MRTGLIYLITNDINNKVYVGKTVQTLADRWTKHKSDARLGDNCLIHQKMRELGGNINTFPNFHIQIIEDNIPEDKIKEAERKWISYYDSYNNGYNQTLGGEDSCGEYNRKRIYQIDMYSNEIINIYESTVSAIINNPDLDRTSVQMAAAQLRATSGKYRWAYEETLQEVLNNPLTKEQIEKSLNGYKKQVYQIDINSNKIIQSFDSITSAANAINVDKAAITNCIKGKVKTSGRYRWADDSNLQEILNNPLTKNEVQTALKKGKKQVAKIDLETNEILEIFDSAAAAGKSLGISNNGICRVARGERKSCSGFGWKYI